MMMKYYAIADEYYDVMTVMINTTTLYDDLVIKEALVIKEQRSARLMGGDPKR